MCIPETTRAGAQDKSGFTRNALLFDGTGWGTHRTLHSDMRRTEYRMKYDVAKPFHHLHAPLTLGKLRPRPRVYDLEQRDK